MDDLNTHTTTKSRKIEDYGKFIKQQDKLLVLEKTNNYCLISGNNYEKLSDLLISESKSNHQSSILSISPIGVDQIKETQSNSILKEYKSVFSSPQEFQSERKQSSFFSTSEKSAKLTKLIINPFKSSAFKKKLNFNEEE